MKSYSYYVVFCKNHSMGNLMYKLSIKAKLLVYIVLIFASLSSSAANHLSQDVGEMMMVGFRGTHLNRHSSIVYAIKHYHIGGVILFDHVRKKGIVVTRNIDSPQQLKQLTKQLQDYAKRYHDYPLFIAVNQEGGMINALLRKKHFKLGLNYSAQKLGEINNPILIGQQAYQRGLLLKQYGININLAPVAALNINPTSQAIGKWQRSFGNTPQQVTKDLAITIKAYHRAGIFCTLKHFPGLGSSNNNTDYDAANVTKTWRKQELIPYNKLMKKHNACDIIMVAHSINQKLNQSNLPSSLSKIIITNLLRNKLHFTGLIMTDDMDAAAIRKHYPSRKAIKLAITAGNDIILYGGTFGYSPKKDARMLFSTMLQLANSNPQVRSKIIHAANKIRKLKTKIS